MAPSVMETSTRQSFPVRSRPRSAMRIPERAIMEPPNTSPTCTGRSVGASEFLPHSPSTPA
jgi:hypothetical protein